MGENAPNDERAQGALTDHWRERVRVAPTDSAAWLGLGVAYADDRRVDMALEALDRAIELDPRNVEALSYRARLLAAEGKHEEAKRTYLTAIGVSPDDYALHYNLGLSCLALGQFAPAMDAFSGAAKLAPLDEASAHGKLGLVLFRLGRHAEAIDAFLECSSRDIAYFDTRVEEADAWEAALAAVGAGSK